MESPAELERRTTDALCRKSLKYFVQEGWHVLEPETPLVWNWHLDVLCDHLQAILEGPKRKGPWAQNLIINVPPGTMKSLLTSVFAPAWQWLRRPAWRAVYASANPRVSLRDSLRCKDLIESEWYQKTFKPTWSMSEDQNAKSNFKNSKGGFRIAVSVGSKITGDRVDGLFIDDPLDASESQSELIRSGVNFWFSQALRNRLANMVTGTRVLIMQRLHEEDLSGYLLAEGGWDHLCIPMEAESEARRPTFLGWTDTRKPGELLMPARFPRTVLDQERVSLGSSGYAGQMQQRPSPAGGDKFKAEWWRFWTDPKRPSWKTVPRRPKDASQAPAVPLPEDGIRGFDAIWQSWDCTFKGKETSDYVVGITVGISGANRYVLEMVRKKMGFAETQREVLAMSQRWQVSGILVEDKANGSAIIETLKETIPGIIEVNPQGGKEARAAAMEPKVEAGNWLLPEDAPWLDDWITEFGSFPKGKHDDCVDAASQVEVYMTNSGYASLLALCQG